MDIALTPLEPRFNATPIFEIQRTAMRASLLLFTFISTAACHPLSMFGTPALPSRLQASTSQPLEVLLDDRGIPHIYASTLPDAVYALGFMHGRDRLFQVTLLKHAATGRLSELFGKDLIETDRALRLASWGLDRLLSQTGAADRRLLAAYVGGLNAGAKHRGRTAEMKILGTSVPTFTEYDVAAIMRLQAWQLGTDFNDELVRHRLLQNLAASDPRRAFIEAPVASGGASIIGAERAGASSPVTWLSAPSSSAASNSWAVDGAHTQSGHSVLANDPHLGHMAPGVFYLAQVETPDFVVAGATLPGTPLFAIGFGRDVAWGMTTSYVDAEDLIQLEVPKDRPNVYRWNGRELPFTLTRHTFGVGKNTKVEQRRSTFFGPVLPDGYPGTVTGETFALRWGTFNPELNTQSISGFYELAKSKSAQDADSAVAKIRGSGQNVLLAFTDGSIAYRLAAFAPERLSAQSGRVPRLEKDLEAGLSPFLDPTQLPQMTSPKVGYLVAANQRVVEDSDSRIAALGQTGAAPSRAKRIHERIQELMRQSNRPSVDELLAIQQDTRSVEAPGMAKSLHAFCPSSEGDFCEALKEFDGNFSTDSLSALPYTYAMDALAQQVVRSLGVSDEQSVNRWSRSLPVRNAIGVALASADGEKLIPPALANKAMVAAHKKLLAKAGSQRSQWRWGRFHTLAPEGPLARIPLLGGFFRAEALEEGGDGSAVRAEGPVPVAHGACLRMIVEMSSPPKARLTLDTGQGGTPNEPHWMDQRADWRSGKVPYFPFSRDEVERVTQSRLTLVP